MYSVLPESSSWVFRGAFHPHLALVLGKAVQVNIYNQTPEYFWLLIFHLLQIRMVMNLVFSETFSARMEEWRENELYAPTDLGVSLSYDTE